MGTANRLADATLRGRKWKGADEWLSDGGSRGAGRLVAKVSAAGIAFYYAYFDSRHRRRFHAIGPHDSTGRRGTTLQQARDEAAKLSAMYRGGVVDLHDHHERERAAEAQERVAVVEANKRAEEEARKSTLRQLLDAYRGHLERFGKQSAGDVRRMFKAHVFDEWAGLSDRRASELTSEHFVPVLAKLVEAGKGRTAGKLRSYLRAAYALALKSKTDPEAPLALRAFGITQNPIASVGALSRFNRERHRVLTAEELHHYLKRVETVPEGAQRDALRLVLMLGGQRPAQLLRVRPTDVDVSGGTITLLDGKGSRQQPRRHVLPLSKEAKAILQRRLKQPGEFVFSTDTKRALRVETISAIVTGISAAMVEAKHAKERFELRDLRRTCETMLAALGVSRDVRAQLQSHGLGGVQNRHYDRHDYAEEKKAALRAWERRLVQLAEGRRGKVILGAFGAKRRATYSRIS